MKGFDQASSNVILAVLPIDMESGNVIPDRLLIDIELYINGKKKKGLKNNSGFYPFISSNLGSDYHLQQQEEEEEEEEEEKESEVCYLSIFPEMKTPGRDYVRYKHLTYTSNRIPIHFDEFDFNRRNINFEDPDDEGHRDRNQKTIQPDRTVPCLLNNQLALDNAKTKPNTYFIKSKTTYPSKKTILRIIINKFHKSNSAEDNDLESQEDTVQDPIILSDNTEIPVTDANVYLLRHHKEDGNNPSFSDLIDQSIAFDSQRLNTYTFSILDEDKEVRTIEFENVDKILGKKRYIQFNGTKNGQLDLLIDIANHSDLFSSSSVPSYIMVERQMTTVLNVLIIQ